MKKSVKFAAVLLSLSLLPSVAFCASPWVGQGTYSDQVRGKLEFGVKNLLGGWTEVIARPVEYHKAGKCAVAGIFHGIFTGAADMIGGALHVATFPITQIDLPLPDNGVKY